MFRAPYEIRNGIPKQRTLVDEWQLELGPGAFERTSSMGPFYGYFAHVLIKDYSRTISPMEIGLAQLCGI